VSFETLSVRTNEKTQFVDVTSMVQDALGSQRVSEGACLVYVPHTTAGVTINESADPSVQADIVKELNAIVPFQDDYAHAEGNSAAHIKASIVGPSVMIPVRDGRLALGTWQGIYLAEFDGPRTRSIYVQLLSEAG
jgi:secondary thiamine-phosphate synthase enzyme